MDVDDDDAFLYGDSAAEPAPAAASGGAKTAEPNPPAGASKAAASGTPDVINGAASGAASAPAAPPPASSNISAAMAACVLLPPPLTHGRAVRDRAKARSLAAYGIDPTTAVAAEAPEDGGVEEEDPQDDDEEDEEDSDEDDVKFVFSGQANRLDMRKTQTAPTNVIGIGKWAHTSTGQTAPVAPVSTPTPGPSATPKPAHIPGQTTEYTPAARPGATPTGALVNPQIPPPGDGTTAPNVLTLSSTPAPTGLVPTNGPPGVPHLPVSTLPVVTAQGTHPKVDPSNPTGVIPSTGNNLYDLDAAQFEGSGQPWRRPGADLTEWFNFGFDEVSFPKFLRFRAEMEAGRQAMMNANPMAPIPPAVMHMLEMSMRGTQAQAQQQQQMLAMQQMMAMQNMAMPGMPGMQGMQGGEGMMNGAQQPRQVPPRASATPAASQGAELEEVKGEEGETAESVDGTLPAPNMRGRGMARGMPARGAANLRGRGGAVPIGPRAVPLTGNIPKGPKAGRFKDKDRVDTSGAGSLDYGGDARSDGDSRSRDRTPPSSSRGRTISRSRSPISRDRSRTPQPMSRSDSRDDRSLSPRKGRKDRDRSYDDEPRKSSRKEEYSDDDGYSPRKRPSGRSATGRSAGRSKRDRDRSESPRRDRERDRERPKRKRDDGSQPVGLGPGGWFENEEEGEERRSSKRGSRNRTEEAEEDRSSRRSKRR